MIGIDLSRLPKANILTERNEAEILAELTADMLAAAPELEQALRLDSTLESRELQARAYRIYLLEQQTQSLARSLMLAYAKGPELDHLGAMPFINTGRKVLILADPTETPPTAAVFERDDDYRSRLQSALEGFTTAGSIGAYQHHALAADPSIKDVSVSAPKFQAWQPPTGISGIPADWPSTIRVIEVLDDAGLDQPMPGDVKVTVLARAGNGTAETPALQNVEQALNAEKIRPLNDRPRISGADINGYQVVADLWFYPGPDPTPVMQAAEQALQAYVDEHHQLGHDIPLSGLIGALQQPGIQRVNLVSPLQTIINNHDQASWCEQISLNNQGTAT